jgi:hypothetical protein
VLVGEDKVKYIERLLNSKKMELNHIKEDRRTSIAVFNAKENMLVRDIDMFEACLQDELKKTI